MHIFFLGANNGSYIYILQACVNKLLIVLFDHTVYTNLQLVDKLVLFNNDHDQYTCNLEAIKRRVNQKETFERFLIVNVLVR